MAAVGGNRLVLVDVLSLTTTTETLPEVKGQKRGRSRNRFYVIATLCSAY